VLPKSSPSINPDVYRIIVFGAAGAGKRTNLKVLQEGLGTVGNDKNEPAQSGAASQSQQASEAVNGRLLVGANKEFRIPLDLQTLGVEDESIWINTMRGASGLIFVADSDPERFDQSLTAMGDLIGKLSYFRLRIDQVPIVVQYNKRDVEGAVAIHKMEDELNPLGLPAFATVARDYIGVKECLDALNLIIEKHQPRPEK
jgi:hypothetical protein